MLGRCPMLRDLQIARPIQFAEVPRYSAFYRPASMLVGGVDASGMGGLISVDRRTLLYEIAKLVHAVEQAMFRKGVNGETHAPARRQAQGLHTEINGHLGGWVTLGHVEQF